MKKHVCCFASIFCLITLAVNANVAFALSEDYQPDGILVGSFIVYPKAELGYSTDDNIYAIDENAGSDTIVIGDIGLDMLSDWANHQLNFRGNAKLASYSEQSDEDYNDFKISADGRIDIKRDVNIFYGAGYQGLHEPRGSANEVFGTEPTTYQINTANLGYTHAVSTITLEVEGKWNQYSYDDTPTSPGGDINNSDRGRVETETSLRLGYKINKEYEAFIKGIYFLRDYDEQVDDRGFERSSNGYSVSTGIRLGLTGVTSGEFFVGTRVQEYDDDNLSSIEGLDFGAALLWNPTELTEFNLYVVRTVEETITLNSSGFFSTLYGVSIDHSLLENFVLQFALSTNNWDYEGIDRTDDILEAKIGAQYYAVQYLFIGVDYKYTNRTSNENGLDYTRNLIMARIGAQI